MAQVYSAQGHDPEVALEFLSFILEQFFDEVKTALRALTLDAC